MNHNHWPIVAMLVGFAVGYRYGELFARITTADTSSNHRGNGKTPPAPITLLLAALREIERVAEGAKART